MIVQIIGVKRMLVGKCDIKYVTVPPARSEISAIAAKFKRTFSNPATFDFLYFQ